MMYYLVGGRVQSLRQILTPLTGYLWRANDLVTSDHYLWRVRRDNVTGEPSGRGPSQVSPHLWRALQVIRSTFKNKILSFFSNDMDGYMPRIKVIELNQIYNIIIENIFISQNLHVIKWDIFWKMKFWILQTTSDEDIFYVKVIKHDEIYNYLVDNIFIWSHLGC